MMTISFMHQLRGEHLSRSPSPTLAYSPPRSLIPTPSSQSPPLNPQKSDSLNYSWTSDEMDFVAPPPQPQKPPSSNDEVVDSDGDVLTAPKYNRAISILIPRMKKKAAIKSLANQGLNPLSTLYLYLHSHQEHHLQERESLRH